MSALTFVVAGKPEPQGSGRAFTYRRKAEKGGGIGARIDTANPNLYAWRRAVARQASQAMRGRAIWDGPIRIAVACFLPRPKALKGQPWHITKPDSDKLGRAILDALSGIVYVDDAQVVRLEVSKSYAVLGSTPGARITLSPADPTLFHTEL